MPSTASPSWLFMRVCNSSMNSYRWKPKNLVSAVKLALLWLAVAHDEEDVGFLQTAMPYATCNMAINKKELNGRWHVTKQDQSDCLLPENSICSMAVLCLFCASPSRECGNKETSKSRNKETKGY